MNVPSVDVFNGHGLYDIVIDSSGSRSVGQSVSGWANLRPSAAYPLLESSSETVVKFYWCSNTDRDAARQFRRRCQAYAIATLPSGPADKGKQTDNGRRVLAWWETDGLWMITNEPEEEVVALGTWWADRLEIQRLPVSKCRLMEWFMPMLARSLQECRKLSRYVTSNGQTDKTAYAPAPYHLRRQSTISIWSHSSA
jgi:hypothetical protein